MKKLLPILLFLSCIRSGKAQTQDYRLHFQNETILLPENGTDILGRTFLPEHAFFGGKGYAVVQFFEIPNSSVRISLSRSGVELLDYLPEKAYIASISKNVRPEALRKFAFRSVVPVKPEWKISKALFEILQNHPQQLLVQFYDDVDYSAAVDLITGNGLEIIKQFPSRKYLYLKANGATIEQIADYPFVAHLDVIAPKGEPEDQDSRSLHQSSQLDNEYASDLRLNGEGVNVQVRDDGTVGPHIDFKGRLTELSRYNGSVNHGDMVAGSSGGAGNLNPLMKGIATGAGFFITEYDQSFTDTTIGLHRYKKVMVTNTSYTDGCNRYTSVSQTIDVQHLQNKKLIHVFSAGNNNGTSCGYGAGTQWGNVTGGHKQGKNGIAAANIDDNIDIAPSSSRGPAHDGRIKPDVSAHGTNVNMTFPNNTYTVNSGTSFSSPITAGILAVMYQTYRMENQGNDPDGALMKAILLNTATEIGNYGPDFKFGWGVANAQRATEAIQNQQYSTDSIDQSEVRTIKLKMPDNIKQAKIMLLWPDYQASPNVKKALVNDLDLTVTSPDGRTMMPFVLDPTPNVVNLDSPAKRGRDSLNNVEQVAIENPLPGAEYTVTVSGYNIPKGLQQFYLTWDFLEDNFIPMEMKKESYLPGEKIAVRWITPAVDTGAVKIEFTPNNGQTWSNLGYKNINLTHTTYTLPKVNTEWAKFRFTYKNRQYQTSFFSICEQPKTFTVTKICPDSVSMTWDAIAAPVSYEPMFLGDKYMEPLGKTKGKTLTAGTPKGFFSNSSNWFTIRSEFDSSGMISKRKNAISVPAALLNCPLSKDLALEGNFLSTEDYYSSQCDSMLTDSVEISIMNAGDDIQSDAYVSYQFGSNAVVTDTIAIKLGRKENSTHTFSRRFSVSGNGSATLKAWVTLSDGDLFEANDTIRKTISYNVSDVTNHVKSITYSENFNRQNVGYPEGWTTRQIPADNFTWENVVVPGIDGLRSNALSINLNQAVLNRSDELFTPPVYIDSTVANPYLMFDMAYGAGNSTLGTDLMEIFAYENCDKSDEKRLLSLSDKNLSTDSEPNVWQPNYSSSWRLVPVNISALKGKTIIFGFRATSKKISVLYIDNVRFGNYNPVTAKAEIIASKSTLCPLGVNTYAAINTDPSFIYEWTFAGGNPARGVGPGPIDVTYPTATANTAVTLKLTSPLGTSSAQFNNLVIQQLPVARFSVLLNGLAVECKNQSQYANSYLWDFGDTNTSDQFEPAHVYNKEGSYSVVLSSKNECGEGRLTRKVNMTSTSTGAIGSSGTAQLLPNPNEGSFNIILNDATPADALLSITNLNSTTLWESNIVINSPSQTIKVDQPDLASGVYLFNILTKDNTLTLKFIKK